MAHRGRGIRAPTPRCGARGGGSGRVRPLAGWPRLRLLRQILDELVPGVEQFLLVDDVIAVEDGAALVPGQEHGDPLWDVCADQGCARPTSVFERAGESRMTPPALSISSQVSIAREFSQEECRDEEAR